MRFLTLLLILLCSLVHAARHLKVDIGDHLYGLTPDKLILRGILVNVSGVNQTVTLTAKAQGTAQLLDFRGGGWGCS